jgi:copper(I)-binding protein
MRRRLPAPIGIVCAAVLLAGCARDVSPDSGIRVVGAWVRSVSVDSASGAANTAAYMRIASAGAPADRLLSVRCGSARMAEVHRTRIDESGLATMGPAGPVEIPAEGAVEFEPGGLHVMLMGLERSLTAGDSLEVTLVFERVGEVQVKAEARAF